MRRTACVGIVVATVLAAGEVGAQEAERSEPRSMIGVTASVWFPQGDADDFADTSIGVRPQFTFWVTPMIGIVASFDWVFVAEQENVGDTKYYAISAGGRLTTPRPARIKPFGELLIGRHTLDNEFTGTDSDFGFRIGGGALFELMRNIGGVAQLSYSTASIDSDNVGVSLDIDAFVLEAGLAGRF